MNNADYKPAANAAKPAAVKKTSAPPKSAAKREPVGEKLSYPGGFPVYLSRYLLLDGERPRAALRFFNAGESVITGLRFRLYEKDSAGRVIAEYSLERRGLFAERGFEFAVADTVVNKACAAIEVRLEAVFSDPYEYVIDGDGATVHYGTTEKEPDYFFRKKESYSVKKRRTKYMIISLVTVLAVTAVALFTVWRMGLFDRVRQNDAANVTAETTYIFRNEA